jgi:hypothetical protein
VGGKLTTPKVEVTEASSTVTVSLVDFETDTTTGDLSSTSFVDLLRQRIATWILVPASSGLLLTCGFRSFTSGIVERLSAEAGRELGPPLLLLDVLDITCRRLAMVLGISRLGLPNGVTRCCLLKVTGISSGSREDIHKKKIEIKFGAELPIKT